MAKPGLLEAGTLFSHVRRIQKRHNLSSPRNQLISSKSRRGWVLFLLILVCSLVLATRLLWCFMYSVTGTATEIYVEPRSARSDIILEETEVLRAKGVETVLRVWEGNLGEENLRVSKQMESKDMVETDDNDKEETNAVGGRKKAEVAEQVRWSVNNNDLILNQLAELASSNEEPVAYAEDGIDEGGSATALKRKLPDAMAYLERVALKLANTQGDGQEENGPYHSRRIFKSDYGEMKRRFKVFVYPHDSNDPFHLIFEPRDGVPSGNYASEEFFQQALMSSVFVTKNASEADFFFMPVSITKARLDKRIGVGGLQKFCASYVTAVRSQWEYWNRSSGADHFYLSCHSVARNAMDQVPVVKQNAVQLLCPASYFLASYITHKDASVPQIWPREGVEPEEVRLISQRKRLAFFAGALNSLVRQELERKWSSDDKILVHKGRVPYNYSEALLTSKFCLHARGYEVNTARLGDAMFYGCVPVVIANHYDLPFQDTLDWSKFSIVISSLDISLLKKTLEAVTDEQYAELHRQVLKARKHFQWHNPAQEYDAFHTVMYELWKRRHILKRSSL